MDYCFIKETLKNRKIGIIGEDVDYRKYSVMIPLVKRNGEEYILFELRARSLNSQPGEISFPGGKIEEGEENFEAAIRETCEELGTEAGNIDLLGQFDMLITQHNKIIYPFVGQIKDEKNLSPSKDEVDHVFYVPVSFFIENEPIVKNIRILSEPEEDFPYVEGVHAKDYKWDTGKSKVYFYRYNDYIIWGLTAKIIYYFIKKIMEEKI